MVLAGAVAMNEGMVMQDRFVLGGARAIDGDSLRFEGREYRLKGIDAPEYNQLCRDGADRPYPCGREALAALSRLVAGERLDCTDMGTDRYGRTLAYCSAGGIDVNRRMVEMGMAVSYRGISYLMAEQQAKAAGRGIWQGRFDTPQDWRNSHRTPHAGDMTGTLPADDED